MHIFQFLLVLLSAVSLSVFALPAPHHLPQPSRFPSSEEVKNKTIAIVPWVTTAASLGLNGVQAFYLQRNKRLLKLTEDRLKDIEDRGYRRSTNQKNDLSSPVSRFPEFEGDTKKRPDFERRTSFSPTRPRNDEGGVPLPNQTGRRPSEGAGLLSRRSSESLKSFVESRNQRLLPRSTQTRGYQEDHHMKPWSPLGE